MSRIKNDSGKNMTPSPAQNQASKNRTAPDTGNTPDEKKAFTKNLEDLMRKHHEVFKGLSNR